MADPAIENPRSGRALLGGRLWRLGLLTRANPEAEVEMAVSCGEGRGGELPLFCDATWECLLIQYSSRIPSVGKQHTSFKFSLKFLWPPMRHIMASNFDFAYFVTRSASGAPNRSTPLIFQGHVDYSFSSLPSSSLCVCICVCVRVCVYLLNCT